MRVLVGLLLFSTVAHATTVKIRSELCGDSRKFEGSGYVIRDRGKTFVVTSEHVVLHTKSPKYCHSVEGESLSPVRAEFVAEEWGNGLALLAVPGVPAGPEADDWRGWPDDDAPALAKTTVSGFPYGSTLLLEDDQGSLHSNAYESRLFVLAPRLLELTDTHGEFGMSGGPILVDGKFAGVLSHQLLVAKAGGGLSPEEMAPEIASPENHLLAIPRSVVKTWLAEYFKSPESYKPLLSVAAEAQYIKNLPQVNTGNLRFYAYGTGGTFSISVDVANIPSLGTYRDANGHLDYIHKFFVAHPKGKGGDVLFFRDREGKERSIHSLPEFFSLLNEPGWVPVGTTNVDYWSDERRKLKPLGEAITVAHERLRRNLAYQKISPGAERLLFDIQRFPRAYDGISSDVESVLGTSWMRWRHADVDDVLARPEWAELARLDGHGADDVRRALQSLAAQIDVVAF